MTETTPPTTGAVTRRSLLLAATAAALGPAAHAQAPAASPASAPPAVPIAGSIERLSIDARANGTRYPVRLYAPPGADRSAVLPIVYLVDADWRLDTLARVAEARQMRVRLAGVANESTRNRDDLPAGACNAEGGGDAAFLDFLRTQFQPFVESRVAVDPAQRALWGHSYGGAFVLFALFAEPTAARSYSAYLAADPSIRCLGPIATSWEADFAALNDRLPVRMHFGWANPANAAFADRIQGRGYRDLHLAAQGYPGGHDGMIPAAFADALDVAFGPA